MKFTQTGRVRGDETAPYDVTDYKAKTVSEFMTEVLEGRPHEWGYICVDGWWFDHPYVEYKDGSLIAGEIPAELMLNGIERVKAEGGWSRMDYCITTK